MVRFKKIAAVLLIALGVVGLVYRSFPMPQESHQADLGPLEFRFKESRRLEVPVWISVALVAIGTGLLAIEKKR